MKSNLANRAIALTVMALAGLGSMATSQVGPSWELQASTPGAAFVLDSAQSTVTKHASLHLSAEATAANNVDGGQLIVDASVCLSSITAGAPASMRLIVQSDESGNGDLQQLVIPYCPEVATFNASASGLGSCEAGLPCEDGFNLTFQRTGDPNGDMEVTWNANGIARGYGSDHAPAGAELTVTIDP